jgi:hypothetical protein
MALRGSAGPLLLLFLHVLYRNNATGGDMKRQKKKTQSVLLDNALLDAYLSILLKIKNDRLFNAVNIFSKYGFTVDRHNSWRGELITRHTTKKYIYLTPDIRTYLLTDEMLKELNLEHLKTTKRSSTGAIELKFRLVCGAINGMFSVEYDDYEKLFYQGREQIFRKEKRVSVGYFFNRIFTDEQKETLSLDLMKVCLENI